MAKQRPDKPPAPGPAPKAAKRSSAGGWAPWARGAASAWIVWHLFAVFISPFNAFSAPRASELVARIATSPYLRWYSDPIYINGGYQFFSPDPPVASMLVRYQVSDANGGVIASGEFPNRANDGFAKQWPRLWYHRHMMLADQTGEALVHWTPGGPPEGRRPDREANERLTLRAYARHLLRKHDGATARIDYIRHFSLFVDDAWPARRIEEGRRGEPPLSPTDPQLYRTINTVTETADRLDQPLLPERAVYEPAPPPTATPAATR